MSSQPTVGLSITAKERATALLAQMTLAEKIGQMTQVEKNSISPAEVAEFYIGSVLSGGGGNPAFNDPTHWAQMVRGFQEGALQTRLAIPLLYGVDAVHGHNNVKGAVIFPHNVGLGATRDADLLERIGRITATEILATGVHWTFAPAVSVPQDIRWGRTYEGFSEDTNVVIELAIALIRGLQAPNEAGLWALPSVKHFVADGGTTWNSTKPIEWLPGSNWQAATQFYKIDQGDAQIDEATLRRVHLRPYEAAIAEGALNIMVSFSSWQGLKMHAQRYLLTDVLKNELGFEGFLISDWMAIQQLNADFYTCVVQSINAGLDMVMVPFEYQRFIATLTEAVQKGDVSQARIDNAVERILRVKFELGLFEKPLVGDTLLSKVGCTEHRAVAREAVRKSAVLLKNDGKVLPLPKNLTEIIVAGNAATDLGIHCGGWSIEWQGAPGNVTMGATVFKGIQESVGDKSEIIFTDSGDLVAELKAEVGIVVVGEHPYAEGFGDQPDLSLTPEQIALIEKVRPHCQKLVLILLSGRPLIITPQLPLADAVVAAWLPGTEGAGIADVLFGDYPFTGKLAHTWPRTMEQIEQKSAGQPIADPLFPFGFGLS
ncbi:MAG: glycoside hydrolase family 3 C-terminal domain-containing protein [Chloroflexi bacterium]|nr:glycoside hydrolase family 3 C-terminal domain-containing protein [Chloroflexota bacterium]